MFVWGVRSSPHPTLSQRERAFGIANLAFEVAATIGASRPGLITKRLFSDLAGDRPLVTCQI
jgi:hypothetical protein